MKNWKNTTLGQIGVYINGKAFKPSDWKKNGRPIIRIQNLTKTNTVYNYFQGDIELKYLVKKGDLLISWSATLDAFIWNEGDAVLNQHIFRVEPHINKMFLFYLMKNIITELYKKTHGCGIVHITKGYFEKIKITIPESKEEQSLIVSEIEKQFTRLDKTVESLKTVKQKLASYRKSVLKAAFDGKFTQYFRRSQKEFDINKYASELENNRKLKGEYKNKDIYISLQMLSSGWTWISMRVLSNYITSGSRDWKKYYSTMGSYFIRTQDINTNSLLLDNTAHVTLPDKVEGKRSLVQKGDILITITGANVGKVASVKETIPEAYVSQSVALIRLVNPQMSRYIQLSLLTEGYGKTLLDKMVYGVGRPVLSLENIRDLMIPICSPTEQEQVIIEIESRFSIIEKLEETVNGALKKSELLRKSILKSAFEGKLVKEVIV